MNNKEGVKYAQMSERIINFTLVGKRGIICDRPCKDPKSGVTGYVSEVFPVYKVHDRENPSALLPVCGAPEAPAQDLSGDSAERLLVLQDRPNIGKAASARVCMVYAAVYGVDPIEEE